MVVCITLLCAGTVAPAQHRAALAPRSEKFISSSSRGNFGEALFLSFMQYANVGTSRAGDGLP